MAQPKPKAKSRQPRKLPTTTPKTPPQSVDDVLIAECMDRVSLQMCKDYAVGMFAGPKSLSEKEKKAFTFAVLTFATLGWTVYHAKKNRNP